MAREAGSRRVFAVHLAAGAVLGVFLLHPVTMLIYWFEFHPRDLGLVEFVSKRMAASFTLTMLPMTGLFVALGASIGGVFAAYYWALVRRRRTVVSLRSELATDLRSLIEMGEGERIEFKSTARWDVRQGKPSKAIEIVIAKTIAGFLNHDGGSLLIGVGDDGEVLGLESDYKTLRQKNRDGFEQFVMSLIKDRLGGHVCSFIHPVFANLDGREVCRLVVERSERPVYLDDRGFSRYFVRAGNSTRELDVHEAVELIRARSSR